MPRIFDNIDNHLLPTLKETLEVAHRADFCVGYFNLRGWKSLDSLIEKWNGGDDNCCRLLIGMQRPEEEQLRLALQITDDGEGIDNLTPAQEGREAPRRISFFTPPITPHNLTAISPTINEDESQCDLLT